MTTLQTSNSALVTATRNEVNDNGSFHKTQRLRPLAVEGKLRLAVLLSL